MKRTRFYILLAFLFSTNCPIPVLAEQLQNEPAQQEQFQKDPIILTKDELKHLQDCDDQQVYLSNEFRKVLHFVESKLEVNKDSAIHDLLNSSKSEFKFIPQNLTYCAIKELKSLIDNNKDKFEQEYTSLTQAISFYEDELNNKDAHIKFNKDDNTIECNSLAADCFDNDSVLLEESGAVKAKVVRQNPDATPRIFERPVRINFDVPNRHALTVIGLTAFHGPVRFRQRATFFGNVRIDGNLIVGGTITSGGQTLVSNAQNVGNGDGEVFQSKTDGTLNFRTLQAGTSNVQITTNADTVTITAIGDGDGNVIGPVNSTDNAVARYEGATGKLIQNSGVIIDDSNNVSGVNDLTMTGNLSVGGSGAITTNLSVGTDAAIGNNLAVGNNVAVAGNIDLTTNPSTLTEGAITKDGTLFVHNLGSSTNTFVGLNSGATANVGTINNTAIGNNALDALTTGDSNTAVGLSALTEDNTGSFNTAVGLRALNLNTSGSTNTAVGQNTLASNTTGFGNVAIGSIAGRNISTGNNNIVIGGNAAGFNITEGNNNIAIGNDCVAGDTDTIRIGQGLDRAFIAGIRDVEIGVDAAPVLIDSENQLGTMVSSIRYKKNVENISDESNNLIQLRPVKFMYKKDESNTKQYGLIAEEVSQIMPELVVHDQDGQPQSVKYHILPVLLLNELKNLRKEFVSQQNELQKLHKEFDNYKLSHQ